MVFRNLPKNKLQNHTLQEAYMFSKDNEGETEPYSFLIDNNKSLLKDDDLLGTKETLNSITTQDLLDYKDKYFVTDNMVVSVVSSLPFEYVKKVVEEEFINKIPSKPQNKVDFKTSTSYFSMLVLKSGSTGFT